MEPQLTSMRVRSGLTKDDDQRPFVHLVIPEDQCMMSPEDAVRLANVILLCAYSASQDRFFLDFMQRAMNVPQDKLLALMTAYTLSKAGSSEHEVDLDAALKGL